MIIAALIILGLFLIYLEFFLTGGIAAFAGAILLIGSVVVFAKQVGGMLSTILFILSLILLSFVVCRLALFQIRRSKNSLFLSQDQEGFQASSFDKGLIGKIGECHTDLKPSGHIVIDNQHYQGISQSGYLPRGTSIIVIEGRGAHLVVKPYTPEDL